MNIGNIIKGLGVNGLKIVDNMATGGIITNVIEDTTENPKGKFDGWKFARVLVSSTVPVIILIGINQGWWTAEDAENAVEVAKDIEIIK